MKSQQFNRVHKGEKIVVVAVAHGAMSNVARKFNVSRKTKDTTSRAKQVELRVKYVPSEDRVKPDYEGFNVRKYKEAIVPGGVPCHKRKRERDDSRVSRGGPGPSRKVEEEFVGRVNEVPSLYECDFDFSQAVLPGMLTNPGKAFVREWPVIEECRGSRVSEFMFWCDYCGQTCNESVHRDNGSSVCFRYDDEGEYEELETCLNLRGRDDDVVVYQVQGVQEDEEIIERDSQAACSVGYVADYQAQGIQERVHWKNKQLRECMYVVEDKGISLDASDKFVACEDLLFDDLCKGLPALAVANANYCDECGGVDMCRHILSEMDIKCDVINTAVVLGIKASHELLRLAAKPELVSLASPHLRYVLAKVFAMGCSDPRLAFWCSSMERLAIDIYPNLIVPQSLFSDVYEKVSAVVAIMWEILGQLPGKSAGFFGDMLSWITSAFRTCVQRGVSGCVDAILGAIKEAVSDALDGFWEKHKSLIIAFIKTLIRIAMDYTPTSILLEYLWDPYMNLNGLLSSWFDPKIVAQGEEDMGLVVTTLVIAVFVALGKTIPKMKLVSDTVSSMISAAAIYNRSNLWNHFTALGKWVRGGDDLPMVLANFREIYPNTVDMIMAHIEIVEDAAASKSTSHTRTCLGYYYAGYLREKLNFGKHKEQLLHLAGPAVRFIASTGVNPIEAVRRRPSMFVFAGKSGIGKSRIISVIANMLANRHKENYMSGGSFSSVNAIYNVNVGDEYCSGYDNQDIWLFDEWFQEKDSEQKPSKSIEYAFTLVSTRPNKLNMAAVDDKGKTAFVSVILAATNVDVTDRRLGMYIKSIHDPNAICTRVNYRVRPCLKSPYSLEKGKLRRNGVPFEDVVHPRDMFTFLVTTVGDVSLEGDLDDGHWSWKKLVQEIDKEYLACRNYVPDEHIVDLSDFDVGSEKDEVEPQGWLDWWTTPKVKMDYWERVDDLLEGEVSCGIVVRKSGGDFKVCSKSDIGAVERWVMVDPSKVMLDDVVVGFNAMKEKIGAFKREWVIVSAPYTFTDIALGLTMMSVVVAASVVVGRKLKQVVADGKDVASVVIDSVKYWWNGEKQCYEPQGSLVTHNGVTYFKVYTKEGIKYYPQGVHGDLLKLVDNQRTIQQVPVITESLFSLVKNGRCYGNGFALTDQRLFMPHHVFETLKNSEFSVSNGKIALVLPPLSEACGYFVRKVGSDGVVLCLLSWRLNGIRSNLTKIVKKTPLGGLCRQYFRNASGELEQNDGTYTQVVNPVEYTFRESYRFAARDVRNTTTAGRSGMCGAIYMAVNEVNDDRNGGIVLGYHVAANEALDVRLFVTFDSVQWTLTTIASTCLPELEGVPNGVGERFGFESGAVPVPTPTKFVGNLGVTNLPMSESDDPYSVALLREMHEGGIVVDPMDNGLKRLSDIAKSRPKMPEDLREAADVVSARLVKHAIVVQPNWVQTFTGGNMLPSVSRQAAVGPPLSQLGPTKNVMCLSADELQALGLTDTVLPNTETLKMLYDLEDKIKSGFAFQNAAALSLKEEARLASKVAAGNTRLFAGAPGHEFLLQRKYFYGVLATMLRKNTAVHSALGIDPANGKVLHDLMMDGRFRAKILSGDYQGYDMCFSPEFFPYVSRIIRSLACGKVVGDDIIDEDDYVRYVLLMRLAFNRMQLGKEVFEPKAGHPSGSALTTILNIIANILLFTYALAKMMNCSFDSVFDKVAMLFLGDDSHVVVDDGGAYDTSVLVEAMRQCGFIITDCDKKEKPKWREPYVSGSRSSYTFLGRHFTCADSVLEFKRVEKMLKFTEERRVLETHPQAILSYREEIARWFRTGQVDWCEKIMPQLKHFGFEDVETFVAVGNGELVQRLLNVYLDDPMKMKVAVPVYNRYKPQGLCDDEIHIPEFDASRFRYDVSELRSGVICLSEFKLRWYMMPPRIYEEDVDEARRVYYEWRLCVLRDDKSCWLCKQDAVIDNGYVAQGLDDDESKGGVPVVNAEMEDATFVGPSGDEAMSQNLRRDYTNEHMDLCNRVVDGVFSRPYAIEQAMVPTLEGTQFSAFTVPSAYFFNNFNAQAKLANAVFMRCVVKVKLVVASGPFVTGKLLMSYRPRIGPTNEFEATGDPCVEIDLSSANSGLLSIPTLLPAKWSLVEKFVSPGGIDVYTSGFDFAWVTVWTLALPSESVPYTVYAWLEDVELRGVGHTSFTLAPQGKDDKERKVCDAAEVVRAKHEAEMENAKWKWKVENTPGWLNKVGASVETVGGCIETLEESVLGPLGDFMDKAGDSAVSGVGMALMGGCCAPLPGVHANAFFTAPNWAQAQMITNLPAIKLAVVQNQKIVLPREIFGSKVDEMNIRNFCSRMGLLGRALWSGTDVGGTNLVAWDVIPGNTPVAPGTITWGCNPPPVAYMCTMFRLHRGGMRFRISIAKTMIHTGTLEIVYQMGLNSSVPSTPAQDSLSYRYIWDVTKSSSLEFEIPYIARTPWTQIYFQRFGEQLGVSDVTTGRVYVNVINPLTTSGGVVPSAVTLLFYASGGEDFEVALPGMHQQFVQNNSPLPDPAAVAKVEKREMSKAEGKEREDVWVPQGLFGDDQAKGGLNSQEVVLFREVNKVGVWGHMTTVGERVLSMRALIKRFGLQLDTSTVTGTYSMYHVYKSNFFLNTIVRAFAFWSGGYRLNFQLALSDFGVYDGLVPIDFWLVWNYDGSFPYANVGAAHYTITRNSDVTTIEVPYYSVKPFDYITENSLSQILTQPLAHSFVQAAAADDFQFGFQTGIPTVTFALAKPPPLY